MLKNMVNDIEIKVENRGRMDPGIDDDWNPMRDDYDNIQLNSYNHGPGANLDVSMQRPAYRNKNNEVVYKIMVNRIPRGLTEVGLENILLKCGSPKISKCHKETTNHLNWALVEFKTLQEAERAILVLDSQPPYNMRVGFARSDEENERLKKKREEEERLCQKWAMQPTVVPPSESYVQNQKPGGSNRPYLRMLGRGSRGRFILNAYRQNCEKGTGLKNCVWSSGIPDFRDPGGLMYNPRTNQHDTSNRYLQNIVVTTTGLNSVRKVIMGRGFVPPESREEQVPSEISQVKTFGSDVCIPLLPCKKCGSQTTQKCSQCGIPYCSRICQKDDYGRHKPECIPKGSIDFSGDASAQDSLKFVPISQPVEPVKMVKKEPTQQPNNTWGNTAGSVVGLLGEGTEAVFTSVSGNSDQYHGFLSCREVFEVTDKLMNLGSSLQRTPLNLSFWPAAGTLVAVKYEGSVWRAHILQTPIIGDSTIFKVALCDLGKIEDIETSEIFPLTSEYYHLPELAVTCDVLQSSSQLIESLAQEGCMSLKVQDSSSSKITAHAVNNGGEVIGVVSIAPWVPHNQGLTSVQLVPPCQVIITAYHHQHALYVRPVGRNYQEQMFTLLQKVAAVVVTSVPLDRAPRKDEMVACLYKNDGNYYRAIVQDAISSEEYRVFFVDFGDSGSALIKDMKFIPWELKLSPCMAVKVSLKGVAQGPLTEDAVRYLNMVVQKEQQLRLECSKQSTDGVELFSPDDKSFNAQLQEFLMPEWKSCMSSGQDPYKGHVYLLENTQVLPLIKGGLKSGFTDVVVIHVMMDGRVAVSPIDRPEIEHVIETLSFQINEYCESTDQNSSYNPRESEVCLVKFKDGAWHRAVNIRTITATQSCQVVFLDYGNVEIVEFKNIRRMVPDFVNAPTLMSMCHLDGMPEKPTHDMIQKITEIVPANRSYEVEVLDKIGKGEFKIRIPELSNQLKSAFSELN